MNFRNQTAIVNVSVAPFNIFRCDNVGQQHSALEDDLIGTGRNAPYSKMSSRTVITDAAGFPINWNQMELLAPIADDPVPDCHVVIMLRQPAEFRDWR